jgi:hypothetical protein
VRDDLRADRDRGRRVCRLQQPALLDVQLDEGADVRQSLRVATDTAGVEPHPAGGVGVGGAVRVVQPAHGLRLGGAGHQFGTQAGQAEPAALLLGETDQRDRHARRQPAHP